VVIPPTAHIAPPARPEPTGRPGGAVRTPGCGPAGRAGG